MGFWLKQSTAVTEKIGPFLDSTDGNTAETGLTIAQADVRLSKNGGNFAQKTEATSCTHDELGYYGCPLDATDTGTLGRLKLVVHESGALAVWHDYMVVPANVWDALFATDKLQVDAVEISGDGTAADDLELLVENCKGTDHKVLLSTDAQDLSGSLDVQSAASVTGAVGSVTGAAGSVTGAVGSVTGNVGGNVAGSVASLTGHTVQTGDNYARLGAPAGASVSADVAAVKGETASIVADTGTDGVVVAAASKTGYKLASDGLDTVATTAPAGVASDFREMMVQLWRRFFKKSTLTATELKTYADNDADVLTTQTVSDAAGTQTQGASS